MNYCRWRLFLVTWKLLGVDQWKLFCDSKFAINIWHNQVKHDRIKYVQIDHQFIKEKLEARLMCIPFVPSEDQLVDMLTKGLAPRKFEESLCKLGMQDIHSPAWGKVIEIPKISFMDWYVNCFLISSVFFFLTFFFYEFLVSYFECFLISGDLVLNWAQSFCINCIGVHMWRHTETLLFMATYNWRHTERLLFRANNVYQANTSPN